MYGNRKHLPNGHFPTTTRGITMSERRYVIQNRESGGFLVTLNEATGPKRAMVLTNHGAIRTKSQLDEPQKWVIRKVNYNSLGQFLIVE